MTTHDAQGRELFACSECKCRRIADEFEVDRHGHRRRGCKQCKARREARKCPHGRKRNTCRDCGGASICEHNRERVKCRECGGSQICPHNRRRTYCRDCGGGSICEHNRERHQCYDCGGSQICEHGRIRNRCRECGGSQFCEHNRQRAQCRVCDPAGHLRYVISTRVRGALKSNKDQASLEYLGCSIQEFKAHIESTFEPGMSWDNYGAAKIGGPRAWQIDHIVPIKFETIPGVPPTLEEVAERLHWRNTQALWATDNMAKRNRYVGKPPAANEAANPAEPEETVKLSDDELV